MKVLRNPTSNTYCVPAALSALMDKNVDEIIPLVREHLGDQPIAGLYYPIALRILRDNGFTVREVVSAESSQTIKSIVKRLHHESTYLITIRGHILVYSGRRIIDNAYPEGIMPENYPGKHNRVEHVWEITK